MWFWIQRWNSDVNRAMSTAAGFSTKYFMLMRWGNIFCLHPHVTRIACNVNLLVTHRVSYPDAAGDGSTHSRFAGVGGLDEKLRLLDELVRRVLIWSRVRVLVAVE